MTEYILNGLTSHEVLSLPYFSGILPKGKRLSVNTGLKLQFFTGVKLQTSGKFF
jgi:hypothetical protein